MARTTIATLRERVERLNDKLGTEFNLWSWSNGRHSVYRLDRPDGSHVNPRGATASEMDYFIDGLFAGHRIREQVNHKFEVDDYALDGTEPTPSPEANTVRIVELIDSRADEYVIEETGKTVAEHNPYYPADDPVVAGVYPNMGDPDKVWHFPESRLYKG